MVIGGIYVAMLNPFDLSGNDALRERGDKLLKSLEQLEDREAGHLAFITDCRQRISELETQLVATEERERLAAQSLDRATAALAAATLSVDLAEGGTVKAREAISRMEELFDQFENRIQGLSGNSGEPPASTRTNE